VYESADEGSAVLGALKRGVEVSVIETVDGWSLIELQGHRGYVKEIDLKFAQQV
jgi:SH3-like domain-containing protein